MNAFFYASVLLLALLLFFPASRLIWVLSVRRMQRRHRRKLSAAEIQGQKTRARFIALMLVVLFSWFFNLQLLSPTGG